MRKVEKRRNIILTLPKLYLGAGKSEHDYHDRLKLPLVESEPFCLELFK
jgi:hypothetical protein